MAELMGTPSDFEAAQLDLMQRRGRYAKQQELNMPGPGQMVGNRFVATNPLNYLAESLRAYGAKRGEEQATEQLKDLQGKRQTAVAEALRNFGEKSQGAPAFEAAGPMQPSGAPLVDPLGLEGGKAAPSGGYTVPARAPDLRGAYADLMDAPDAALRNAGMQGIIQMPQLEAARLAKEEERQFRRDEAVATRQARMDELKMRLEDQQRSQTERLAAQKELRELMINAQKENRQLMASLRPERQAQIIQTDAGPMQFVNGQAVPIMGPGGVPVKGAGAADKTLNESQANATMYGLRMAEADKVLRGLEGKGVTDTGKIATGVAGTVGAIPLVGESLRGGAENVFNVLPSALGGLSEEQQQTKQARTNFITAVLRKESGASISPTEFATAEKNYFPAAGDSPTVIAQKQAARQQALQGISAAAGPGAQKFAPAQTPAGGTRAPTSSGW